MSRRGLLPVLLLLAAFLPGCERKSRHVVRLPLPAPEWLAVASETRPGSWLSSGDAAEWTLPPGPPHTLSGAYASGLAGDPAGELELSIRRAGAGEDHGWRATVALESEPGRWSSWSVGLPRLGRASTLSLRYRAAGGNPKLRSLFITEPALVIPHREEPRTIVLFLIDTLRADHVSGYGYGLPTTPRIDAFFRGALRAEKCVSTANWTLPAHASLFLSQPVARHGVARFGRTLPDGAETLAAAIGRAGYRTLAVTGGGFVDPVLGFGRGFDRYEVFSMHAAKAVDRALAMLEEHRNEPVFLFFHTYQVHDFEPEEPVVKRLFGNLSVLGPNWPDSAGALASSRGADPRFPGWIRARYDAALRSVDDAFGRLLDGLSRAGRLERTAMLFTSDHGEGLCSHDFHGECLGWTHGTPYLYEEEIVVPLQLKVPWRAAAVGRIRNAVSLIDVAPTLADAAGADSPATFEGRSLLAGEPPAGRTIATEGPPLDAVALRVGDAKLIRRTGEPQNAWFGPSSYRVLPAEECFDLAADPREARPRECATPPAAALRDLADRYVAASFPGSLVLKVPARKAGEPPAAVRVLATGRRHAPALRTFGLAGRAVAIERRGPTAEVRFAAGPAPVWLAFEPPAGSNALELTLPAATPLVTAGGRPLPAGEYPWNELAWRSGAALPEGASVFTTPPGASTSGSASPLPNELVTRLLALGYLRGSPALAPGLEPAPAADSAPGRAEIPSGRVRVVLAD